MAPAGKGVHRSATEPPEAPISQTPRLPAAKANPLCALCASALKSPNPSILQFPHEFCGGWVRVNEKERRQGWPVGVQSFFADFMSVYNHRSYLRSPFLLPPLPVGFRGFPPNATRLTTLVLLCPEERIVLCRRCCVNLRSSSAEAPSARPNIGTSLSTVDSLANPRSIGQSE